jgi:hypothetical protein
LPNQLLKKCFLEEVENGYKLKKIKECLANITCAWTPYSAI